MPHTQSASLEMVTVTHCVSFIPHVHTGSAHMDVCVNMGHIDVSKESPIHTLQPTAVTSFVPGSPPVVQAAPALQLNGSDVLFTPADAKNRLHGCALGLREL